MISIREAYKAGLLNYKQWWPNLVAGTIVGIVALPLAMAFAISSGVPPAQGIYTAIIAGLVVGICGGSRVQIAGPTFIGWICSYWRHCTHCHECS